MKQEQNHNNVGRTFFHWGPLTSIAVCLSTSIVASIVITNSLYIWIFQLTMCITLYNMWCCSLIGPGFKDISTLKSAPIVPNPNNNNNKSRFCRRCKRVVLERQHHCFWINTCVGRQNRSYYIKFLYFTLATSLQSLIHITLYILKNPPRMRTFLIFNMGLSMLTFIGVATLLCFTSVTKSGPVTTLDSFTTPVWEHVARNFSHHECHFCKYFVAMVNLAMKTERGGDQIQQFTNHVCSVARIESPEICFNVTKLFQNEVVKVLSYGLVTPNQVCGILSNNTCGTYHSLTVDWDVDLDVPAEKDDDSILSNKKRGSKSRNFSSNNTSRYRVVHISDPHIDLRYENASSADCNEPICCQSTSTPRNVLSDEAAKAGYWGNNRCDLPLCTFKAALNKIRSLINSSTDIDYVIWTGDLQPHDIWKQHKTTALETYQTIFETIKAYLPNILILPTIGNHEMIPVDSFSPSNLLDIALEDSPQWLYETLNNYWSDWLPKSTNATIRKDGFFSVKLRDGLRVISLNTNYCHNKNFWLYIDPKDPGNQLQWLVKELYQAELAGDKVHIIGHIPPGCDDCFKVWSRNFNKIVRRFSDTIAGQFYGHTHMDEFEIFYDMDNTLMTNSSDQQEWKPISVGFIGPAITPVSGNNPSFRIYTIDSESHKVVDFETYYIDLDKNNKMNDPEIEPEWLTSGNFTSLMDINDTLPESLNKLVLNLATELRDINRYFMKKFQDKNDIQSTWSPEESKLFKLYQLYGTYSPQYNIDSFRATTSEYRRHFLCSYVTGQSHDGGACDQFVRV